MAEVLVAVVLMAVILTTLAGFTFATARRAITAGDLTTRESIKLAAVNRFAVVPFDTIRDIATAGGRCETIAQGIRNSYQRCIRPTVAAGNASAVVWVVVRPLQRGLAADSTRFVRMGATRPNPFCTSGSC
jgi:Tfp pilus assembly protein PilV